MNVTTGYAGFVAALTIVASCGETGGRVHEVEMRATAYSPAELRVASGETIVFVNRDFVPHTVTAANGSMDSGDMQPRAEWRMVARASGRYDYVCEYHPTMKGSIVVQ